MVYSKAGIVFIITIVGMVLFLLVPGGVVAQLQEIHGTLGGEFEQQDYGYALGGGNTFSHYRQMANVTILGNLYNRNVLDFNLSTRILNSNTFVTDGGPTTKQHDVYFSLYDFSVNALRRTRFPVFLFVRRDISTDNVQRELSPEFSNKVLTTSEGGRISYSMNNGSLLPQVTLSIDNSHSESANPDRPLDQVNRNLQLSFEKAIGTKTNATLDLLHRTRQDRISNLNYITREIHLYGTSQPNERNQISTTVNYFNEQTLNTLRGNSLWNAQLTPTLNNQAQAQASWLATPVTTIVEGELQDRVDIELSSQWRTLAMLSHSEGRTTTDGAHSPRRTTSALGGVTYRSEFERFLPTASAQVSFNHTRTEFVQRSIGGMLSGAVSTRGFSLAQVSLGNQVGINRTTGILSQTQLQNSTSVTLESAPIPYLFIHNSGSYNVSRGLDDPTFGNRRDAAYLFDASYLWSRGIVVQATIGYTTNWMWTEVFSSTLHRYSAELSFPDILRNLSVQARWVRTYDVFRSGSESIFDASSTYNWRALAIRLRFVRYSFVTYRRGDIEFSVTRPFNVSFE